MKKSRFCLIVFLFVSACTSHPVNQQPAPAWVNSNTSAKINAAHDDYPDTDYLSGRGAHKYLNHAKRLARDDIDNQLSITLTGKDSEFVYSDRRFSTATDAILNSIRYVDNWKNRATEQHHVLAVLSRTSAAELLTRELRILDDMTRNVIEKTTLARSDLEKVSLAYRAIEVQLQRTATERAIYKLLPGKTTVPFVWKQGKLATDFKKLLSRLRIKPLVTSDPTNTLHKAIREGFSWSNIGIDNSLSPDYVLQARLALNTDNLKTKDGYISKGKVVIDLTDNQGAHKGSHTWTIQVVTDRPEQTNTEISRYLTDLFKNEMLSRLLGFANAEHDNRNRR